MAFLGISLLFGCKRSPEGTVSATAGETDNATSTRADAAATSVVRQSSIRSDDYAVLNAVLAHFLNDPDVVPRLTTKGRRVVLHRATIGQSIYLDDIEIPAEINSIKPPGDLLSDLRDRNGGIVSLESFSPDSANVEIGDIDRCWPSSDRPMLDALWSADGEEFSKSFTARYPDARAAVRVWLPGYYENWSVMSLSFGPTVHGATATYVVKRDETGHWIVVSRTFHAYS